METSITVVALIIGTAKNDYYLALNRKRLNYARVVLPPVIERTREPFLTATTKAEAAILTLSVEVPRYGTSPSHSLLSSSPQQRRTCFGHYPGLLSFTDQVLSVAWRLDAIRSDALQRRFHGIAGLLQQLESICFLCMVTTNA